MTYLDNNDFVSKEVLPEINNVVKNWLDSEYSYIENTEDLEDLEEADITYDLLSEVIDAVNDLVNTCKGDFDFSNVDNFEITEDDVRGMVESAFEDYKELMIEQFNDEFEREEYLDEYYSETEF